jgi:hypothetical protein
MTPRVTLFQLLALYGLAAIVGQSKLSLGPRDAIEKLCVFLMRQWTFENGGGVGRFGLALSGRLLFFLLELVECPQCLGFWEGLILGFIRGEEWMGALVMACLVSGSNLMLQAVVDVGLGARHLGARANDQAGTKQ